MIWTTVNVMLGLSLTVGLAAAISRLTDGRWPWEE